MFAPLFWALTDSFLLKVAGLNFTWTLSMMLLLALQSFYSTYNLFGFSIYYAYWFLEIG